MLQFGFGHLNGFDEIVLSTFATLFAFTELVDASPPGVGAWALARTTGRGTVGGGGAAAEAEAMGVEGADAGFCSAFDAGAAAGGLALKSSAGGTHEAPAAVSFVRMPSCAWFPGAGAVGKP